MKKEKIFGTVIFFASILLFASLISSSVDAAFYMKDVQLDPDDLKETYYILKPGDICENFKQKCHFEVKNNYVAYKTGKWVCKSCDSQVCYRGSLSTAKCVTSYSCSSASDCIDGWTCDTTKGICTEAKVCDEGATKCNSDTSKQDTCKGNKWVTETCSSGKCENNKCTAVVGDTTKIVTTNNADVSTPECNSTKVKGKVCQNLTHYKECINNAWTIERCGSASKCENGACIVINSDANKQITSYPACPENEIRKYDKSNNCTCGTKVLTEGNFCCNKKIVSKESDCYSTCKMGEKLTEACYCGGKEKENFITDFNNKVCCKYDEGTDKIKTSLDQCSPRFCDPVCYKTNSISEGDKCECGVHCTFSGKILTSTSEDKTCGTYNSAKACDTTGECKTKDECDKALSSTSPEQVPEFEKINSNLICADEKKVCCEYKITDDMAPTYLWDCTTTCRNKVGCVCTERCINMIPGGKLPDEAIYKGISDRVKKSFSCNGKYYLDQEEKTTRCVRDKKDYECPPGCFWFNDRDCGVDANIGNAIWDFVPMKKFKESYEENWASKMRDLGTRFDLNYWGQSVCNPSSKAYILKDQDNDALIGTGNMVGWIGAQKDRYGESNYSYAVVWYLSGLYENNTYTISLKNSQTELFLWKAKEFNISAGETQQNTTTASVIGKVSYTQVCINFNNSIRPKGQDSLNPEGSSIKEVCRSI